MFRTKGAFAAGVAKRLEKLPADPQTMSRYDDHDEECDRVAHSRKSLGVFFKRHEIPHRMFEA
jgi:hypothetical protein